VRSPSAVKTAIRSNRLYLILVNCPACNAPLFGATECGCGNFAHAGDSPIEITYAEALRASWRIYWPTQILAITGLAFLVNLLHLSFTDMELIAIQLALAAIGLFVYMHRLISRPYSRFAIYLALDMGASENSRLSFRRRIQLWLFLFWRQVAAGVVAVLLAAPLNSLVSLIGLRTIFGVSMSAWISLLAGALAIGPILMKFLIGHQFSDFRPEVKRL